MKRHIYTIALLLTVASAAHAQTSIKETREKVADVLLFRENLLLTKQESDGQFIYLERPGSKEAQKEPNLNTGHINAVVGGSPAVGELYVYQKSSRRDEKISIYQYVNGAFEKKEERALPRMRNNSYNLGLYLTEDKSSLYISAELGKSYGHDDIYLSKWENGKWTKPKNMGKKINTQEAEFAPFIMGDSLFFSRKKDADAYVYGVALNPSGIVLGEPAKLSGSINRENGFNAYYRRSNEQATWLTVANSVNPAEAVYTAYTLGEGSRKAELVQEEPLPLQPVKKDSIVPVPAKASQEKVTAADLVLHYSFNEVFAVDTELKKLNKLLARQANGAAINIKSYSDATGSQEARQRVSFKRGAYVKWYIDKYFPGKSFLINTESVVIEEKGSEQRRTEIIIAK
ncbi:hypothetical protein ACFSKU_17890 [Pontibacter silvestris]|uniref:OmpA family protein n=1 Tax=Pontibacter silvestris TaxID=2305183 RepID=A0ABW4X2D7_9BACT|nr:hypothetical protein [Pontibacter silvestris]MCC9135898.1 hypothetical protein [Pontibacter silvestris]